MGQSNSRHDGSPQSVGIPAHTENLYRSRSSRSFADITVSVCRRGFRRIREYLREKSRPKVENIELSPTVTSIQVCMLMLLITMTIKTKKLGSCLWAAAVKSF